MKSDVASLSHAFKQAFRVMLAEELHTCMPGRIEEYDSTTRKATVLPLVKRKFLDGEMLEFNPLTDIPVMFYGAGNAVLRLPESQIVGQTALLVFTERSMDFWLSTQSIDPIGPGNTRKFDLTDGIAILSVNKFTDDDSGGDNMEMQYGDSVVRIKPNGMIEIGVDSFLKLMNENHVPRFQEHQHYVIVDPATHGGVSSSPSKLVGTTPLRTPAVITTIHTFNDDVTNNEMTLKMKAE